MHFRWPAQTNFQETPTKLKKMLKNVKKFPNRFDSDILLPTARPKVKKKTEDDGKKGLKRLRKHGQQQSRTSVPLADRQFDSFWSIASLDRSGVRVLEQRVIAGVSALIST